MIYLAPPFRSGAVGYGATGVQLLTTAQAIGSEGRNVLLEAPVVLP